MFIVKEEIEEIVEEIEMDDEFVVRFTAVIVLITMALMCFRNIEYFTKKIEGYIGNKNIKVNHSFNQFNENQEEKSNNDE